jgi:xanthine dehydrogenase YagS FAD-binding subunit
MQSFNYERPKDVREAIVQIQQPRAKFIGGGTNLVDLMKGGIETPTTLIDVTHLPLRGIDNTDDGGLMIGALARNSDAAGHPSVRSRYPLLSQAFLSGASPQLRNMATVGGNLLQRTRCYYFYDAAYGECNKRLPGSGCAAREGFNRIHAVLGASDACVATNPSDMSVALVALDAVVKVAGPRGVRDIAIGDFHRLPGSTPERDTNLLPDELILGVYLPPSRYAENSHYLKVRDRQSYAFALVSVAAGLSVRDGQVNDVRVVLGGVAHKPWRAVAVEQALLSRPLTAAAIREASALAMEGAVPLRHNAFKVELGKRAVARAILQAGAVA